MVEPAPSRRARPLRSFAVALVLALLLVARPGTEALAQTAAQGQLDAVVTVSARIPGDARTAGSLGTNRTGSGVVIDSSGLIVTIGYVILEAIEVTVQTAASEPIPAKIVAYDHESGLGLVRADQPLNVVPVALGSAGDLQPAEQVLVVSRTDALDAKGAYVVDRREFAGYWEYLLDEAIFTSPPHAEFGGAALLDPAGRLVGVGSLFVDDAGRRGRRQLPGNMFVPIDLLKPIMGDLLASGHRADPPRPWLGVFFEEQRGRVFVSRVAPDGPGAAAGIQIDDLIIGIGDEPVAGLADFYRKLWGRGSAGIEVPLQILKGIAVERTVVRSGNRYRYLRLDPSY